MFVEGIAMNRRQFCLATAALTTVGISGCATRRVWDDVADTKYHTYYDQINAFYISQDQNQFVILSDRFHYIFKTVDVIPLLKSNLRSRYIVDIQNMRMPEPSAANELPINGNLFFALPVSKLNPSELSQARALGFNVASESQKQKAVEVAKLRDIDVDGTGEFLVKVVTIYGHRYAPKAGVSYGNSEHFYRQYNVPVVQERTSVNAAKALGATIVTPITLAADGVLLLLGLPLLAVFVMAGGLH